jgi:hypothetical protein
MSTIRDYLLVEVEDIGTLREENLRISVQPSGRDDRVFMVEACGRTVVLGVDSDVIVLPGGERVGYVSHCRSYWMAGSLDPAVEIPCGTYGRTCDEAVRSLLIRRETVLSRAGGAA